MNYFNQLFATIVILCLLVSSFASEASSGENRDARQITEEDVEIKKYGGPISTKYFLPLGEVTEDPRVFDYGAPYS